MNLKYFIIVVFGILACLLITDDFVSQSLMYYGPNAVYAMGHRHHRHYEPQQPPEPPGPTHAVPEPSTLLLLGAGLSGVATYLYCKQRKKKR